jgi:predicted O-linked N-acetylglucosamine transferase (SPINDLY family)
MRLRDLFRPKRLETPTSRDTAQQTDWRSLNALASTALEAGQLEEAVRRYSDLLDRRPDFAEGHYKRGNALNRLGRWSEALADYDRAVAQDPEYAKAFCNRGTVLEHLERREEALASYDRAIALDSKDAFAYYNRAGTLKELHRLDDAVSSYDRAIALNEGYVAAYVNRGHLLQKLGRIEEAAESYGKALSLRPVLTAPMQDGRPAVLATEQKYVLGLRRQMRMQICDWRDMHADLEQISDGLLAHQLVCLPHTALALLDSPALHRAAAASWIREEAPPDPSLGGIPVRPRSPRIRIGYFSADLRSHPVALLAAGLFESHDRSRFEVTAFAFGPEANDAVQDRLMKAFERFIDVRDRSDLQVATLARAAGIDIAVNLNGITEHSRNKIFALRAAPVQVNYLGYPGTMGADYMDYLIADRTVIPREQQPNYAEKVLYLPDTFMPFDSSYAIADKKFTRETLGLPSEGFVFCCFNSIYKITPTVFDCWMRILTRVDASTLWLSPANAMAAANLRTEAARRGVHPDRLVFAARWTSLPAHLARLRTADLFLDTLPYNAHATALDALWAGLPVLTCQGHGFAGRVAASLLCAVGLPELITESLSQYEDRACGLAEDPAGIAQLRRRLSEDRSSAPLFDTEKYTRNLEAVYEQIHERYRMGAAPEHVNEHLPD